MAKWSKASPITIVQPCDDVVAKTFEFFKVSVYTPHASTIAQRGGFMLRRQAGHSRDERRGSAQDVTCQLLLTVRNPDHAEAKDVLEGVLIGAVDRGALRSGG